MAGYAFAAFACICMAGVHCWILHLVFMAGQTSVIELLQLKPVAAAGGVAVHAVNLAGLGTGAHAPRGKGIVLSQISTISVEIGIFQRCKIEIIVEPFLRSVFDGQRVRFGVAANTEIVPLHFGHGFGADDPQFS